MPTFLFGVLYVKATMELIISFHLLLPEDSARPCMCWHMCVHGDVHNMVKLLMHQVQKD